MGGVEDDVTQDTNTKLFLLNERAPADQQKINFYSDSSTEADQRNTSKRAKGYQQRKRTENKKKKKKIEKEKAQHWGAKHDTECFWGQDESSESDGGWDFETGGMPLLPR